MNTMKPENAVGGLMGSLISFTGCSMQNLEAVDHIFSIVCGVIGLVITIATCVVIPVIRKVKEARKDGKITNEEAEDIINTLEEGLNEVKDKLPKDKKDGTDSKE